MAEAPAPAMVPPVASTTTWGLALAGGRRRGGGAAAAGAAAVPGPTACEAQPARARAAEIRLGGRWKSETWEAPQKESHRLVGSCWRARCQHPRPSGIGQTPSPPGRAQIRSCPRRRDMGELVKSVAKRFSQRQRIHIHQPAHHALVLGLAAHPVQPGAARRAKTFARRGGRRPRSASGHAPHWRRAARSWGWAGQEHVVQVRQLALAAASLTARRKSWAASWVSASARTRAWKAKGGMPASCRSSQLAAAKAG